MTTQRPHSHGEAIFGGSLLDPATPPAPVALPPRAPRRLRLPAPLARMWANGRARSTALGGLAVALAVGLFLALRPVPQPDFEADPMDDLLNYALLTDEFNALPLEERQRLLQQLIARLKTMSADDSVLMAAFAATIKDKMRERLMENASRLVIDTWDKYAADYTKVPADKRGEFLDNAFVEFQKLGETLAEGMPRDVPDEKRLEEGREQARRDVAALRSGEGPGGGDLAQIATFLRFDMGKFAAPQQRMRGQQLMRDMTRRLRSPDAGGPG